MEIRVQSIKFNADQKLLDFVEKKLSKLPKFYDGGQARKGKREKSYLEYHGRPPET